jgi:hypothetical protein
MIPFINLELAARDTSSVSEKYQRYFFFRDISFQNRGKQNMRIEMSDNCLLCESPGNTKQ